MYKYLIILLDEKIFDFPNYHNDEMYKKWDSEVDMHI